MAEQDSTGQKHISMEAEFKEWGSKTTFGVLAGMLYGGSKEALGTAVGPSVSVHVCFTSLPPRSRPEARAINSYILPFIDLFRTKRTHAIKMLNLNSRVLAITLFLVRDIMYCRHFGEVLAPMQEGKDLKTKRFMWRELMEQRVIRITRGTVLGGARLGTFTAIFCGIQGYMAVKRNVHDTLNVVAAGSATAAAFGLALRGSFLTRIRAGAVGSLLGATLCFPLGYLQTTLQEQAEEAKAKESASSGVGEIDGITATIHRLEKSLSDSEAIKTEKQ